MKSFHLSMSVGVFVLHLCLLLILASQKATICTNVNEFFEDWSALESIDSRVGIIFEVTDKGLQSIAQSTFAIFRHRMTPWNALNATDAEKPRVHARFIKNAGIGVKVLIAKGQLGYMNDTTTEFLLKVTRCPNGYANFVVSSCESKIGSISNGLHTFRRNELVNDFICNQSESTTCIPGTPSVTLCNSQEWNSIWNISMWAEQLDPMSPLQLDKFLNHLSHLSLNLHLTTNPTVESQSMLFPLHRGFHYVNSTATTAPITNRLIMDPFSRSRPMVRLFIMEYFWTSLLFHITQNNMMVFEDEYSMAALPPVVRYPLQSLCWSCRLKNIITLVGSSNVTIDQSGMNVLTQFRVLILATGFMYEGTVMNGTANVNGNLDIFTGNNSINSNLTLNNVTILPGISGLAYYMPATFSKSLEHWIERRIWPALNEAVSNAFSNINLQQLCLFDIYNMTFEYTTGAVVLNADMQYNTD